MNKEIFKYVLIFALLFLIGSSAHQFLGQFLDFKFSFSIDKVYFFHAFFSALICVNLRVVSNFERLFPQLGFIYLSTLVLKLVLFVVFFYDPLFVVDSFSIAEKVALFIPLFVFLLIEAVFVLKILNQKE
ncbi:MAG: DUF6168 family protein [Polaribacter sp.]|uniref:DUF6168 family protein n=1 Tax=Polaribacter sp. TaxID=1920175 RepID=UPI00384E90F5